MILYLYKVNVCNLKIEEFNSGFEILTLGCSVPD